MAVAFAAYIDGTESSSSATAVVNFSSRTIGDLGFVIISRSAIVAPTGVPSGWTLLQSHASTYGVWLYWKILASGDIASLTWTWAAATKTLAHALVYTGHSGTPIESSAKGTYSTGSGTTVGAGSVTSNELMLAQLCSCYSTASKTYNALAGYPERRDHGGTNSDFWHDLTDTNGTWAGGTSNPSFTISASSTYRGGFNVAIKSQIIQANARSTIVFWANKGAAVSLTGYFHSTYFSAAYFQTSGGPTTVQANGRSTIVFSADKGAATVTHNCSGRATIVFSPTRGSGLNIRPGNGRSTVVFAPTKGNAVNVRQVSGRSAIIIGTVKAEANITAPIQAQGRSTIVFAPTVGSAVVIRAANGRSAVVFYADKGAAINWRESNGRGTIVFATTVGNAITQRETHGRSTILFATTVGAGAVTYAANGRSTIVFQATKGAAVRVGQAYGRSAIVFDPTRGTANLQHNTNGRGTITFATDLGAGVTIREANGRADIVFSADLGAATVAAFYIYAEGRATITFSADVGAANMVYGACGRAEIVFVPTLGAANIGPGANVNGRATITFATQLAAANVIYAAYGHSAIVFMPTRGWGYVTSATTDIWHLDGFTVRWGGARIMRGHWRADKLRPRWKGTVKQR